jgi:hypothetical protein
MRGDGCCCEVDEKGVEKLQSIEKSLADGTDPGWRPKPGGPPGGVFFLKEKQSLCFDTFFLLQLLKVNRSCLAERLNVPSEHASCCKKLFLAIFNPLNSIVACFLSAHGSGRLSAFVSLFR